MHYQRISMKKVITIMKKVITILVVFFTATFFAQDYKFGKVSKEELEEKFYPLDSTADAAYLYRERKTHFDYDQNDGFRVITEIHNRIKIYNKTGFKNGVQKIVSYSPKSGREEKISNIKAYTFNLVEGKVAKDKVSKKSIFDERINNYFTVKKMAMPNVKEYCIIDIEYKIISPYRSIDDLKFQFGIPVKKMNYSINIPSYFDYQERIKGYYYIKPEVSYINKNFQFETADKMVSKTGGYVREKGEVIKLNVAIKESLYVEENIPALKDNEPYANNIENYRGGMKYELVSEKLPNSLPVNYLTDWENVSKKIYDLKGFGSELEKNGYYKKDLEQLLLNVTSNQDKVVSIFQFVKSKVKWDGYIGKLTDKGVRKAYNDGVGNVAEINLMLTSMLREAGLNANPVLVSTRDNGVPLFPTLDGFNYVISMVEFPDNTYVLLDATEPYSLPNILPARVLNWNGRKVTKEGNSSWVKLVSEKHSVEENNVSVKVLEDAIVEGLIRTKYSNLNALKHRKKNNHIKEESIISFLENKYNVGIENFKIINKDKINKPISVIIKFVSEDLIEEINGKLYINPLLFFATKINPFKLEDRKFPIDFDSPWEEKNSVSIQIPERYKVESLPEPLAIALPENIGVFKYQVKQIGKSLKTISVLQFNTNVVGAQYYKTLKEFYGKIVEKQSEKIVLVKE